MTKIYAEDLVERMLRGEIPFDEEEYSKALDVIVPNPFEEI